MVYPPQLHTVKFTDLGVAVVVSPGTTLLEAAHRAGIGIRSVCGGQHDCGECLVVVLEGQVSALDPDEKETLTPAQLEDGIRLACCTRVYSPTVARLLNIGPTTSSQSTKRKA